MSFANQTYVLERIAAGKVPGATAIYLQGLNGTPTTTFETLWPESNAYTFLTTNFSTPYIASSDANDTSAGTGARTVTISGVDSTYAVKTETLSLNGQTSVNLVNSYIAINSMVVATAGSGGVPAGVIRIGTGTNTSGVPAVVHGHIAAGYNEMKAFMYTVPASMKLLLLDFNVNEEAASAGGSRAQIKYFTNGGLAKTYGPWGMPTNFNYTNKFNVPLVFPAKTQLQGQFLAAAATAAVTAHGSAILLDQSITSFATWM